MLPRSKGAVLNESSSPAALRRATLAPYFPVTGRLEAALCQLADHLPGPAGAEARDAVALALLRASVKGLAWVMLDGGPGRVFGRAPREPP